MSLIDRIGNRSYTPHQIEAIRSAFEATLRDLGLRNNGDPLVQIVAKAVIDIASRGESDPEQIRRLALKELTFHDAEDAATTALLDDGIALARADLGNIQRYNPADRSLAIVVQRGFKQDFLRAFERVSLDDASACARAMREKTPILVPDVSLDDDFREYRGIAQSAGFASVLSIPLITGSAELIGVLSVHFATARNLGEIRMDVLRDYAGYAADGLADIFGERR